MTPRAAPLPQLSCPLCGGANQCVPARAGTFEVACWCRTTPVSAEALARIPPELRGQACLCPRCAAAVDGQKDESSGPNGLDRCSAC